MDTYKNVIILGTSHIAIESVKKVEDLIKKLKPDIIALELDKKRFYSLISKERKLRLSDIKELGIKGFLFNLFGAWVEKKLGKSVGVLPGSEMKMAINLAKGIGAEIALIDQDISITIKRLMKEITWREKFRFIKDFLKALIFRKSDLKFDLKKVPSQKIIEQLLKETKNSYPSFYKVLVKERNRYLAKSLYKLLTTYPKKKVLAILGAGHEKAVLGELKSKFKKKK